MSDKNKQYPDYNKPDYNKPMSRQLEDQIQRYNRRYKNQRF